MAGQIPILLDTDIGSDIDDAFCLSYLLRQKRCELLGITTVTGNVAQRAALAEVICRAAGREDIPIHTGAPEPLWTGPGQPHVPQYNAIARMPHRKDYTRGTAVEFLRATIRANPNQITLLTIGPLTNIAMLFTLDPEIPSLLKELVLMCGVFTPVAGHGPATKEWNAFVDPIATAIVYRTRPTRCTSIGLDVTMQCKSRCDEVQRFCKAAGGPLDIVAAMCDNFPHPERDIIFHDPLAAATIFEPRICEFGDGEITVETVSPTLFGLTTFNSSGPKWPHRIAMKVKPAEFFEHYVGVVTGK